MLSLVCYLLFVGCSVMLIVVYSGLFAVVYSLWLFVCYVGVCCSVVLAVCRSLFVVIVWFAVCCTLSVV